MESPAQPTNITPLEPEIVKQIMLDLQNGRSVNVIDAESKGLIVARIEGFNRDVNKKHVEALTESVKNVGCFLQPIMVLDAVSYFEYYPERKLVAGEVVIDKDSPECYRVVVNLDGQHRYEAEKKLTQDGKIKPSLKVEIIELLGITPDRWMVETNTQQKSWTSKDRTCHILSVTQDPETNIFVADKWQNDYGMGERAAHAILRLDDTYKKSWQVDCMNKETSELPPELKGTPKQRERGTKILHAFEVGFSEVPKMLKNMAAINLAIEKYSLADDADKEKVVNNIILFFTTLDKDVARTAAAEHSVVAKKNILSAEWNRISKMFNTELAIKALEEQAITAEAEWQKAQESKKATQQPTKKKNNATKS